MQKSVEEFLTRYDLHCGKNLRYIDLVSEIGELGKELQGCDYGNSDYQSTASAKEEGDCIFALIALCCGMGIDAEEALNSALTKYERRFAAKGSINSGEA